MLKKLLNNKKIAAVLLGSVTILTSCHASIVTEPYTFPDMTTAPAETDLGEPEYDPNVEWQEPTEEVPPTDEVADAGINPLTGCGGYSEAAAGKRPAAVMVNNLTGALPQYGIEAADLIYELPVEGGITRLMAVYADYTAVPAVCSVRSCRYYYPILCLGMDAIYCHWGLDQTIAKETLERTGIDHLDGGMITNGLFKRDAERQKTYASEHTGYLDGSQLAAAIKEHNFRTDLLPEYNHPIFRFVEEDAQFTPDEAPAKEVTLTFSGAYYSTFQFDDKMGEYKKLHSGKPHMDQNTGNQIHFENVFILQTDIHPREDNYLMDVALSGGTGYYAANAGIQTITWKKESETSPIRVYDAAGTELKVNPGKSYIGIIGEGNQFTFA